MRPLWVSRPTRVSGWTSLPIPSCSSTTFGMLVPLLIFGAPFSHSHWRSREPRKGKKKKKKKKVTLSSIVGQFKTHVIFYKHCTTPFLVCEREFQQTHCLGLRPAVGQQTHAIHGLRQAWVTKPMASPDSNQIFFFAADEERDGAPERGTNVELEREKWCTGEVRSLALG
jgi:hypothetical protein